MMDVTRFRGPAVATGGVVAAVVAVDLLLTAAVGPVARWLPGGKFPVDRWVINQAGSRLAGLVAAREQGGAEAARGLGLLIGLSTMQDGVDPRALEEGDGRGLLWRGLYGEGGGFDTLAELSDLVFASGLRPRAVIFAINSYMLVGNSYENLRSREARLTGNRVKPWVWAWENRVTFNHLAQLASQRARLRLFRGAGLGMDAVYRPDPRYAEMVPHRPDRATDAALRARREFLRNLGWFDERNYGRSGGEAASLTRLIRGFRALGSEVFVVLMPERSDFRRDIPPRARDIIRDIVGDTSLGPPVPLIDLEDRVPDPLFFDLYHVDPEGRAIVSRLIAERLREQLAAAPGRGSVRSPGGGPGRRADPPNEPNPPRRANPSPRSE